MNRYGFEPDFDNLKLVLRGGTGKRVPNMELVIDREIKDAYMRRPVVSLADNIEFRYQAGYDYAWISVGMIDPAGTVNKDLVATDGAGRPRFEGKDDRVWADEHTGRIATRADLESYPWPEPDALDYGPFEQAARLLRPGMKAIAVLGKVFTAAWQLMGFENFCLALHDDPVLVQSLVRRIGDVQLRALKNVLEFATVGAVWIPDDIAFHSGTLVPAAWLQEHVFPTYRRMCDLCRAADRPVIYHSDGDLTAVLEMIIATGFDALHPIEPESMDVYEVRRIVGKRLCLVGNIRVHLLATETPAAIRELVRGRVLNLGHRGAYCVGSSNSIPKYVPLENYQAMLRASAEFAAIA